MSESLKPCPFCGASPLMQEHVPHSHSGPLKAMGIPDHSGSWTIECPTDGCCAMIASTHDEVVAAWNRRAVPPPTAPTGELAEVLGALRDVVTAKDSFESSVARADGRKILEKYAAVAAKN